jgi:Domain of unknown function (DUF4352)
MKKLIVGGLAALAIGLTGCSVTGGAPMHTAATMATQAQAASQAPAAEPAIAPAGSAVRDGQLEFRVAKIERLKAVGDPTTNWVLQTTAQGEFIVVTMQVTNVGSVPATYFGQNQKLIAPDGQQFAADASANTYVNREIGIVPTINPGNWIWGRVAFDVPVGTPPGGMKLELHDSVFSGGVNVQIGGTQ